MTDELTVHDDGTIEFAEAPKKGAYIEVLVRYDGKEWLAAKGSVEEVNIQNQIVEMPEMVGDDFKRYAHTGRRDLTITLFDPPKLGDSERKQIK